MKEISQQFIKLPESELRVMQAVWALHNTGESNITAASLMAADRGLSRLKLTTVLTLITRLIGRGYLSSEKRGRSHYYTPLVSEADYKAQAAVEFITSVCNSSPCELISAMIHGGMLNEKEIAELQTMLEEENRGEG
ncbi:MAG: BlaI/MecI/CopY family transcriptional regulator [Clostridia bacterium]|nr:BlaI/MecI/CopY family transcriptional regulator [Clostridia bacterium]